MIGPTKGRLHLGQGNGEGLIFSDEGRMVLDRQTGATTLYPFANCRMSSNVAEDDANAATLVARWNAFEDGGLARLMTAAPRLFEALVALHDAMSADQSGYEDRDELYDLVTSAIAEVDGDGEEA